MDRLANANFNSEGFDAAAALLAGDLRTTAQDFEGALRTHDWSHDDSEDYELVSPGPEGEGDVRPVILTGGFASIRDRQFFEEQLAQFLIRARGIIGEFFPKLVSIASPESDIALAVEAAKAVATSAVREHCNPEGILMRAFPALTDEGIDLPPGLTPPEASEPVEAICSRIKVDLDSSVDRIAKQTFVDGVSNAGVSTNAEPAGATAAPTVNTSQKPSEPPAVEKLPAKKQDLSRYLDSANLTAKQRECASLKWEYELSDTEIARRLGVHRTTVDEHIRAAKKKISQSLANEKHAKDKAKFGAP